VLEEPVEQRVDLVLVQLPVELLGWVADPGKPGRQSRGMAALGSLQLDRRRAH